MEVNIYEAKTNLSKLIQSLVDLKEDEIVISKNGKPLVSMKLINRTSKKRLGIAKGKIKEMTIEEFNSVDLSGYFEEGE